MLTTSISDFSKDIKRCLDRVSDDSETSLTGYVRHELR